jgi:predicted protein tyrosine phosphatase
MPNVLFVCSGNIDRSPTAERLFHNWDGRWEAKSAGIMSSAPTAVTQALVDWADLILVMESIHAQFIHSKFRSDTDKIHVLNIEDVYLNGDPELVRQLRTKATPILRSYSL